MQQNYKLLILDYGGVYSYPYTSDNFNRILKKCFGRLPNDTERKQIIEQSHLLGANSISTADYIQRVGGIMKVDKLPDEHDFEKATIEVTNPPTPEMVDLVHAARNANIKVSLLSDMYLFEAKLTRPWGRYEGFDYVALSAEQGMTKWDARFFQRTLDHFAIAGNEALFVDDIYKNVEVAKEVGIDTIFADKQRFQTAEHLVQEIKQRLGVV